MPRLKIVDVGAMTRGVGVERYAALLTATSCDVIGFEPNAAEFERLNSSNDDTNRHFLPYFIGDGSTQTFYECNSPYVSSLFEPNTELLAKFQILGEWCRVIKTYPAQTKRLDDIPEVKGTDFLKVDVQGGELLVFQGGIETLKNVLVISTEVEFAPLYKHQPLFSDIDPFLRALGFQCHRIMNADGRAFRPLIYNNNPHDSGSHLLWADAVYIRDYMAFDQLAPGALLKLAVILHENYRSFDLVALALESHDRKTGSRLQPAYLQRLYSPARAG